MRATVTWALILLGFRALKEISMRKILKHFSSEVEQLLFAFRLEQQKRKQPQQTGCYVDKNNKDSLFCVEGLSFVVLARSLAMCGQTRSVITENKRSN